jgi:hypothetical protein
MLSSVPTVQGHEAAIKIEDARACVTCVLRGLCRRPGPPLFLPDPAELVQLRMGLSRPMLPNLRSTMEIICCVPLITSWKSCAKADTIASFFKRTCLASADESGIATLWSRALHSDYGCKESQPAFASLDLDQLSPSKWVQRESHMDVADTAAN